MQQLAAAIRHDIEPLVDRYDAELRQQPGYDHLPEALRRELERRVLTLVADSLEVGDQAELVQYVHERALQWSAQGLPLTWFQQALIIPEKLLTPLISTVAAGNFLWQALNRCQGVIWQLVAEDAHQTEARFRAIVETAHSGIMIFDDQFRFVYANEQLTHICGYSQAELIGADFRQLLDEDSLRLVADRYVRRQRGEDVPVDYEVAFIHKDGQKRYVEMSVVLLKNVAGQRHTVAQVLDVTERKRTEVTLTQERNLLHTLIDSLPDQIFVKDTAGRVLLNNLADARAMGVASPAEATGKTVFDLYTPELAAQYHADDMLVIQSGQPLYNREEPGLDSAGQRRWILTTKVPLRDAEGKPLGLVGIARDITQRKQIESTLQESEERFRRFSEATTEGLTFHDKGLILDANPAIVALFGFATADELIGRNLLEFVVPESRPLVLQKMQLDDVHPYEVHCLRKDGSLFPAETSTRVYRYGERTIRATAVRDITMRKRLEDQIRESLARRGIQVETSVQVAQDLATAADLNELLRRVVTLIKERFGYYHAQIFRYDPAQDAVVLVTGYGAAGEAMLAAGHQLPMGHGVVGTAAQTEQAILASDVTQDEDWHPNPYLPDTQGELAVPIKFQDQVLGILDVQSDQAGQLNEDDRLLLAGLCGQIASAVESTRRLDQLRQNQVQLSEALKIAKLAYWEYDVAKDLFLFNDQFYALFHTTAEQQGGYELSSAQYAQNFVHPDDLPIVGAEIERALTSTDRHYSRDLVHRVRYADGGVGYISVNINIDRDEHGQILRYYGANQDITDRQQAQQRLQELLDQVRRSEQLMRTLIDTMPDQIYAKDLEGRFILANLAEARLHGVDSPEVLIGKNDFDFYPRELAEQYWASELPILRDGISLLNHEEPNLNSTGQAFWSSTAKVPLRNDQGDIIGLVGMTADITARKHAEARLQELLDSVQQSERLMRTVIDATPDWIFIKDQEHRYRLVNQGYANSLHIPSETFVGKNDLELGFPEELVKGDPDKGIAGFWADDRAVMDSGQPKLIPNDIVMIDGALRTYNTIKTPLQDGTGKVWGVLAFARDITERERLMADQQKRTVQLQTASEVSRAASSILNLDELLSQTADLIHTRFELYYVGIFLLDDTERWAILRAGTGEAGQRMLADNHRLKVGGNSMIGECIITQQARIALDVGEAATRFNNPLLPLTRSEMALPLVSRGRVIGAATIQSDQPAAFSTDDITVLQSMADQISNAVENARLYEQTQAALREVDAINRRLTGEAWAAYLRQHSGRDVIWLADDLAAAPAALLEPDEQLSAGEITLEPDPDGEEATVTVPILLRGQPIGALRLRALLHEWDDDTRLMLVDIAGHIAQAVENARLVEQTQRAAERERLINEINARVRQSVDLDAILRTAVNELGQSLKAARVMARVGTATIQDLPAASRRGETND